MKRREFLSMCTLAGIASTGFLQSVKAQNINIKNKAHVIVIGGGFAGATVAKYLRILSKDKIEVTLIEPRPHFISCPMSNRILGGDMNIEDITLSYDTLSTKYGIKIIPTTVIEIKNASSGGKIKCLDGKIIPYDKLIVAPGIDFFFDKIKGYDSDIHIHAWKAGKQTLNLREQLKAMPDGGRYIISIPPQPYRCPPGPYERACLVANYFKHYKPKSKVIVLDANPDITSKPALFKKIWREEYATIIEYNPSFNVTEIDAKANAVFNDVGDKFSAEVLNILPPMKAGNIATQNGLGEIWCDINYVTFESTKIKDVYVIGDANTNAPQMPKSAHIANQQGKYCAYAIVHSLAGIPIEIPTYNNTCYSFANSTDAGHVAAVYKYNTEKENMLVVPNSSAVSPAATKLEGEYAKAWAKGIWLDTLG